ncbi:GntR family transcriptional regulator [Glutamicibacter sp. JC586]|uniref:GntR family transcriptional regulator n=1 Tax=Glutamicibacter sp. JC586 TaxID=2590552 RepID=UPI00135812E0|nr:GntR family transcriptional regulator [Glutamicibacter sp. JC586]
MAASGWGVGVIVIDPANQNGPSEQIRAQIAALIYSGALAEDTKLPTVRQLAGDLRVATGTVARAYKELEAAGMVRTGRANGTKVNAGQTLESPLLAEVRDLTLDAQRAGLGLEELQKMVEAAWNSSISQ